MLSRILDNKDKPSVEGAVGHVSRQIIAGLRHYQCFNIQDLNNQIFKKLKEINRNEFQKRPGSRIKVFETEEQHHLHPLPQTRYKLSEWKTAKVQLNYHIQVERMYYSVPYDYVREQVEVRLTTDLIEVYFKEARIASHKRMHGEMGQFSTHTDHMPDNHKLYLAHTPENNREWAETIGGSMVQFVTYILENNPEKKALKILGSLRNLSTRYTNENLEQATYTLLTISKHPTLSVLKGVLERKKKQQHTQRTHTQQTQISDHGFSRGAEYFGGQQS